jgi:hypothetical protein
MPHMSSRSSEIFLRQSWRGSTSSILKIYKILVRQSEPHILLNIGFDSAFAYDSANTSDLRSTEPSHLSIDFDSALGSNSTFDGHSTEAVSASCRLGLTASTSDERPNEAVSASRRL